VTREGSAAEMPTAYASRLTGSGRSAIAVIRVWGPNAVATADAVFRPHAGPRLADTEPGRPRVGRVGTGVGDEVVAVVIDPPPTAPEAEIQCHGGLAAVELVLEALRDAGAALRDADDWVRHQGPTPLRAEARLDLARAETLRTSRVLMDQEAGALDRELERIAESIATEPDEVTQSVNRMIKRSLVGLRLLSGWRLVLCGRPNVGKSRLINALAGFERSIVSEVPGTTRDVVAARLAIDGWPVQVADLAGLREAGDTIESAGIQAARRTIAQADLILLVLDRAEPLEPTDRALLAEFPAALTVANKIDLPEAWSRAELERPTIAVSAERGDGIDALVHEIGRGLVSEPPPENAAVPFRSEHVRILKRAQRLLESGRVQAARNAVERLRRRGY